MITTTEELRAFVDLCARTRDPEYYRMLAEIEKQLEQRSESST